MVALIAGILGFGGVAAVFVDIARTLAVAFVVLFIIAVGAHALRGKTPPV
ncbi:MAG: DUF1328 domain-containing protein [Alphaproteobacteria bacterium]